MAKYYITWHNVSHGVGFLKNVLAAFSKESKALPSELNAEKLLLSNVNQSEMEAYFGQNPNAKPVFDKIVYFYTDQKVINETTSFAFSQSSTFMDDEELSPELREAWKDIRTWYYNEKYKGEGFVGNSGLLAEVREELAKKSAKVLDEFNQKIWRFIHYFPIEDQTEWLVKESNLPPKFKKAVVLVNASKPKSGVKSLRENYSALCNFLLDWFGKNIDAKDEVYINISYGSYIIQVAFFVMSETGLLPEKTFFLNSYDSKNDNQNRRFKNFTVAQVPNKLFSDIRRRVGEIYKNSKSPARKSANDLLTFYINNFDRAFTILVLGERGVGKSRLVREIANELIEKKVKKTSNIVYANCAAFDNDNKAESELFGYVKGAYTGAEKEKEGLFFIAKGGILFLDEVHHLSKLVQAKLMTALQTDDEGNFKVRKMGSTQTENVKCLVIFASNRTITQLRDPETGLLPDFYDRISQFIIEIPPLRETVEDRESDWKNTWKHLFKGEFAQNDPELMRWLKGEMLPGNFRDLEKIALAYHTYNKFEDSIKNQLQYKSAYEYARSQYEKYHGAHTPSQLPSFVIDLGTAPTVLEKEFLKTLGELIVKKYGSADKAETEMKKKFGVEGSVSARTVRNWLDKKGNS